jgi:hypothetical protein
VRGRLGRLLLELENRVEQSIPDGLEDVAVRGARGWRLNSEVLAAIAYDLGADTVTGLDGSPLTIPALKALDRNIDYDHVARRVTRERLLCLLVALRQFVQQNQLDYEWARRGEPESWLSALIDWTSPDGELTIDRAQLFDGWGRPFAIRRARGARARFRFLEPVVGYELISAGPDGRFGNGDDVFDPFARVLPERSIYGTAVGEEALLRRLHGVELGRATIAMLQEAFGVEQPIWDSESATASRQPWQGPSRLVDDPDVLAARAVGNAFPAAGAFRPLPAGTTEVDLPLAADPHRYLVVAGAYGTDGVAAFDAERLRAGVPVLVDVTLPERLRPHEPLSVPLHLVGLEGRREIRVEAKGGGPIAVAAQGSTSFTLAEGEERTVDLALEASGVGSGSIHLRILTADGQVLRRSTHRIQVLWDGSLRAQHAGAVVVEHAAIGLRPPAGSKPVRSFLVVTAPRDLVRDPGFDELRGEHPALHRWAYSLRGATLQPSLAARLAARPVRVGPMPVLEAACAAVAWSSLADNDEHEPDRARAVARLQGLAAPASMRERSALLVALSTSAAMITHSDRGDPVAALVGALREDGWHAPLTEKNRPTVMARMAAGLLLADRRDVPGRELFNRARAALIKGEHGGKVLAGEDDRALDGWIGTVALAIAARQLGEDALADQLTRGLAPRLYLGMEGGFEAGFWLLAASAYGVFGIDGPSAVALKVNGGSKQLDLEQGVATLVLPDGKVKVDLDSSAPVVARLEARYVRPVAEAKHAPLSGAIEGHVGHVGDTAALEVTVRSRSKEVVARPVLEIMLPSAAVLPKSAQSALSAADGVAAVEPPDGQGLLRIYLTPLDPLQQRRLPLPLRWIGRGRVEGLSIVLFDADQPWMISSTPSRTTELSARPEESWQ